jgi:hypothetical protein
VGQIDTPLLTRFTIDFDSQLVYDTPLLHRFLSRTEMSKPSEMFKPHEAIITFGGAEVKIALSTKLGQIQHIIGDTQVI